MLHVHLNLNPQQLRSTTTKTEIKLYLEVILNYSLINKLSISSCQASIVWFMRGGPILSEFAQLVKDQEAHARFMCTQTLLNPQQFCSTTKEIDFKHLTQSDTKPFPLQQATLPLSNIVSWINMKVHNIRN